MARDYQWHRAEVRKRRAKDWNSRPDPEVRPPGPWLRIGLIVAIGALSGLAISLGISETDRSRYDRLMSGVGLAAPEDPGAPRG